MNKVDKILYGVALGIMVVAIFGLGIAFSIEDKEVARLNCVVDTLWCTLYSHEPLSDAQKIQRGYYLDMEYLNRQGLLEYGATKRVETKFATYIVYRYFELVYDKSDTLVNITLLSGAYDKLNHERLAIVLGTK